jgi:selenocysteine lyase/cysteine desulfurase
MNELDVTFVRSRFPAFNTKELENKCFFENAGGSFATGAVVSRLTRFYTSRKVQPYAAYEASSLGGKEMDEARIGLASLLNINQESLHFGPSTTQNTYVLSQAFRQTVKERNVIIVTNQDHEANTGSWRKLSKEGFEIREWQVDNKTGSLNPNDLIKLLDKRVLLVAFPHCSNIIGEINPVQEICQIIKSFGAYSCVDGVSYAPHGFPDLKSIGSDIYLFSLYKTYGPHVGIMYLSQELNEFLIYQGHYFNNSFPTKRFTPAGPDHAQIAASAGIVDYIRDLDKHHFTTNVSLSESANRIMKIQRAHESKLLEPLLAFLNGKDNVRLLGPNSIENRVPTVSLDLGNRSHLIVKQLVNDRIMTDSGDFYAVRLLEALGVKVKYGVLRLSFVHYTTEQEVEHLICSLNKYL